MTAHIHRSRSRREESLHIVSQTPRSSDSPSFSHRAADDIGSGRIPLICNDLLPDSDAVSLLQAMLTPELSARLGGAYGVAEIKAHPFFSSVRWDRLLAKAEPGPLRVGRLSFAAEHPSHPSHDPSLPPLPDAGEALAAVRSRRLRSASQY